ncbi:MAG: TrkA family potassium uptake protein [Spirochaetales bacterium]|nr:MAG: TrkA family potassium uptake protein [Spirochaetales bacterium]
MKQFAIIGVSKFGRRMIEELSKTECEILIIDKDKERIESMKDQVTAAYIADAINEEIIVKLIPPTIDAAIVDLGDNTEASILVTNYLKKHGIKDIIATAESDGHGEILSIVGATRIIFPNREAAKRITPLLVSSLLFNYLPIGNGMAIAETKIPEKYIDITLVEADIRKNTGLTVIAIRKEQSEDYEYFSPEYRLQEDDMLLVVGKEEDLEKFTGQKQVQKRRGISTVFRDLFARRRT